jgi:hypothetical protein
LLQKIESQLIKKNVQAANVEWTNLNIPKEVKAVLEGNVHGNTASESGRGR